MSREPSSVSAQRPRPRYRVARSSQAGRGPLFGNHFRGSCVLRDVFLSRHLEDVFVDESNGPLYFIPRKTVFRYKNVRREILGRYSWFEFDSKPLLRILKSWLEVGFISSRNPQNVMFLCQTILFVFFFLNTKYTLYLWRFMSLKMLSVLRIFFTQKKIIKTIQFKLIQLKSQLK